MNLKFILLLGALVSLVNDSFSQDFVEDLSAYQSITLENFIKGHSALEFSIQERYPEPDFVRASEELEALYFNEVGGALESPDSLSVSENFKKLPRQLSRQYNNETKKLVKKLKRYKAAVSSTSDYVIEPRYLLTIAPNPNAYTLSLEYVLISKPENKIYKIIF